MADQEKPQWHDYSIIEMGPTEFPFTLTTRRVMREDPPKLGPRDDQNQWYEIEVTLLLGGAAVGPAVRFPGHTPLTAKAAFKAIMKAALIDA